MGIVKLYNIITGLILAYCKFYNVNLPCFYWVLFAKSLHAFYFANTRIASVFFFFAFYVGLHYD